ncbi:hypothetical protein [Streptomyces sp. NPDC002788]
MSITTQILPVVYFHVPGDVPWVFSVFTVRATITAPGRMTDRRLRRHRERFPHRHAHTVRRQPECLRQII